MNSSSALGIIAILILLIGGYFFLALDREAERTVTPVVPGQDNTARQTTRNDQATTATSGQQVSNSATVRYTDQGFIPATVTILQGGTVTWINDTPGTMWVASAIHPSHEVYSGTDRDAHCPDTENNAFDQCEDGEQYSFTFDKIGDWGYHDHLDAGKFGTVTVTP